MPNLANDIFNQGEMYVKVILIMIKTIILLLYNEFTKILEETIFAKGGNKIY